MLPCFNEATCMRSADLEQDIILSAKAGFRYIEVRKEKLIRYLRGGHTLAQVKALYEQYGLQPVCLNALQGTYMRTPQDKTGLKDACDFLCYCCRELGCPKLEYIAPFKVPIEDAAALEAYTVESLQMLSDVAKHYGVKIAVEYMGIPGNSMQAFTDALRIVDKVGRDNVGLLVDTWHHYAWGSTPEELLLADKGQIFMVHISDCPERAVGTAVRQECYWPGMGVVPITEDLINLKKIGYEEEVSIEIFDPEVQKADPEEIIPLAFRHVTEAIEKAEQ